MEIVHPFTLSIVNPTSSNSYSVEWIEVSSPTGSFFVGADHSPLVSLLKPNSIIMYKSVNGTEASVAVTGGILTIKNNTVLALLD